MYKLNILFNDYHNFNSIVKNNINLNKTSNLIDWDDFENTLKKIHSPTKSNVNVHLYDGILLPNKVLELFNKYEVEVTLAFTDDIDDNFLLNYYFRYITIDRLSIYFEITGTVSPNRLYFLLHKLWSSYKLYHIYDPNIIFMFLPNLSQETIDFLTDSLKRQCDNRKNPIPSSFFEYMLRDMIKESEQPLIPYDVFVNDGSNIILNKNRYNINLDFSFNVKDLSEDESVTNNFITVLNTIYSSIIDTYNCKNCAGFDYCQKMKTIFCGIEPKECSKSYEKMWKSFEPSIKYFKKMPQYTINDISSGNNGLA